MKPKTFQEPLLRVMGEMTGFKTGKAIRGEDTYTPVMTLMGFTDINDLGTEASSGLPLIPRLIQWACKNLRNTGEVVLEGRGQWALTAQGVKEARRIVKEATTDPDPKVNDVDEKEAPMMGSTSRGVLEDPYILNLVLSTATCLGHYSDHGGAVCTTCPVAPECQNALFSRYATAAATFATVTTTPSPAPATPVASATSPAPAVSATSPAPAAFPSSGIDWSNATTTRMLEDQPCGICKEMILKGTNALWVDHMDSGISYILHQDCVPGR